MRNKISTLLIVAVLILIGLTACSPRTTELAETSTPAAALPSAPAESDGSEDLTIDLQVNLAGSDIDNFFNWKGNVRYMAAEDKFDAISGASEKGSTHLFMMYLYDVEAKTTMSSGLRGLFLYGVNGASQVAVDNLNAATNADGSITIQYIHRGTAFRFTTDKNGILSLPDGNMENRKIGTPKELEAEFTSDGTAMGVDFDKVWASDVSPTGASPDSMYFWDGDLQVALEGDMLTMKGVLTAVIR
ncbi:MULTISPECIES: hypothetical protein [unclassified Oceanispirochaeta]|uniref:hypothetical protein n=1 Tax=unclassified Oceanispirochaeta TaxID=2635722 RepID=UPI000E098A73|nr:MULTISPECIES: hypothetical protein [unclassified Oceanispirochaeta]MBF9016573.1 hypothetical protein [Oceanispirochaeta sp. M2]NPD73036.1 hypothetical protein [Oceanispirochaeta sp. M1]RDG31382.1 hypothetical protein DV872_13100 [Oceanispirochaeta sp. M1]